MKKIIVNSPTYGTKEILVDDSDYEYIKQWNWYVVKHRNTFYARRDVRLPEHTQIKMHRQLLGVNDKAVEVDHRDHNGLNNQKINLRLCLGDDNKKNRIKQIKGCSSNFIGVTLRNRKEKSGKTYQYWTAMITFKGVTKYKSFPYTPEGELMAAKERDKMAIECFGAFAHLNFNEEKNNNMKKTLQQIFNEIGNLTSEDRGGNDKGGQIHTYLETYDKLFEPFRNGCTILEIGLATGDSIRLWDKYFENSKIVGCDISIVFNAVPYTGNGNALDIIQADATKPEFLELIKDYKFDLVVEDGDHQTASQIATFNLLKGKMNPGGIYCMEDILALDIEREKYLALHDNCEIIDMRDNGRFDNVLIIYKF